MFNIATQMMIQLVGLIPGIIGLTLVFDFIGNLLFGKR